MKLFQKVFVTGLFWAASLGYGTASAFAVVLPGPADINRISPEQSTTPPAPSQGQAITIPPPTASQTPIPKNARNIHFVLHGFVFEHVTAFNNRQLKDLYARYIGKEVSLNIAWQVADALTAKYRQEGYFLSRAFIPAQEISKGILRIEAVEGSIGKVSLKGEALRYTSVIDTAIESIKAEKPIRLQTLERQLLLLNDLPGLSFKATLEASQQPDGSKANLILLVKKTEGVTTLSINNSGSRYIGPYEATAGWSGSLLPFQQTDLSITGAPSLPSRDGNFYTLNATQKVTLSPDIMLDVTAGYSNAVPGYTLKQDDIVSEAENGGIGISYRLIRQRLENLSTRLSVDFRDSDTNILQSPLSRDRIRAAQWGINYDNADGWLGHNYLDVELRHGLPVFDSSRASDTDISRPDVHPDFTKLQLNYTRLQGMTHDWSSSLVLSGQKASGALYSSEEFGYGGMAIGRAYDPSEISGDDGISGSVELHYISLPQWEQTTFIPYVFYDIGKVWDLFPSATPQISGASAGPGLNIQSTSGLGGSFYIAKPLTKPIDVPLYGTSGKAPRYAFQLNYKY